MGLLSTIGAASGRAFGFTRSAIAAATDAFFNRVTLLLPGNGTNGAQNNTFLDSSSNTFSITRNGNATQGTFSPFSQTGWSNYFSSAHLSVPNINFSTNAFCIEGWFYFTDTTTQNINLWGEDNGSGSNPKMVLLYNYQVNSQITLETGTINGTVLSASNSLITNNAWNHVAVVREGTGTNQTKLYINGVLGASGTLGNLSAITAVFNIAYMGEAFGTKFPGYISNFRVVNGSAVYNGNFTPSTAPLSPITNTVLLTCQSNRFVDTNTQVAAKAITITGTPSVQAFSPFAPTAAYSAATNGGSGYFDGSGDYITAPASSSFTFSGNFTIECWFYPTAALSTSTSLWIMAIGAGNNFSLNVGSTGTDVYLGTAGGSFAATGNTIVNAWNHLAVVRNGSTVTLYINGVAASGTGTTSATLGSSSTIFRLGGFTGGITGYVSGWRVVNGSAVYTTAFTPPTAPPTAITNTSLLLNFTNAGITDATGKNVLETVGNAQISTTQSKFGGGSISFDGTGDWLIVPSSSTLELRAENFTIEFFINVNSAPSANTAYKLYYPVNHVTGQNRLAFYINQNIIRVGYFGTDIAASSALTWTTGQWYHIAVVRNGSAWTIYRDGTSVATGTNTVTLGTDTGYIIGENLNAYFDDYRISKFARYTANFTPPTQAFALQ
jgi:hypothetical protein